MLQTGTAYTPSQIMSLRLKGAMYIRMSTELQVESPENQERAIRKYAAQYGIEIIKTYADLGVSGINTEKREQFQAMIDDVEQGRSAFNIVLYLDESRWGRFVDSREADYHRMRLERKNVLCQSCEKPLTLTSNIADRISPRQVAKRLKEYSILSHTIRIGIETAKGYTAHQFREVFSRYLPDPAELSVTTSQACMELA